MLFWFITLLASRLVSLASLVAPTVLVAARLVGIADPFGEQAIPITLYLLIGTAFVFVKHRSNVRRIMAGTETQTLPDGPRRQFALRTIHVLALGLWFGGAAFFNFATAPAILDSFKHVVNDGPSDRTANETIIPANASKEQKDALASALFGSAVGPVFPLYFGMQAICGPLALATALSWWNTNDGRRIHRWRVYVLIVGVLATLAALPIATQVTDLRLQRFSSDAAIADAAKAAFGPWHFASLGLSFVTVCLAGVALAMAARLPEESRVCRSERSE